MKKLYYWFLFPHHHNVISVVIFALQGVYAMSLEYIILTFIALNGSRMWINSARERGSRALSH